MSVRTAPWSTTLRLPLALAALAVPAPAHADGLPDPHYGTAGTLSLRGPARDASEHVVAVLVDGDDTIVVTTGRAGTVAGALVVRRRADGTPEPGFGAGGVAAVGAGSTDAEVIDAARDGAGGVLVLVDAVHDGLPRAGVRHVTATGAVDTGYGDRGTAWLPAAMPRGGDIAADATGRAIVVGAGPIAADVTLVVRLRPDGLADRSFGTAGVRRLAPFRVPSGGARVLVDGSRIVVVGLTSTNGVNSAWSARLEADGRSDASYATGDGSLIELGSPAVSLHAAIDASHRVVVAARDTFSEATLLGRFTAQGAPDGLLHVRLRQERIRVDSLALAADGGPILGGTAPSGVAVLRLDPSGRPAGGFGSDGLAVVPALPDVSPWELVVAARADGVAVAISGPLLDGSSPRAASDFLRLDATGAVVPLAGGASWLGGRIMRGGFTPARSILGVTALGRRTLVDASDDHGAVLSLVDARGRRVRTFGGGQVSPFGSSAVSLAATLPVAGGRLLVIGLDAAGVRVVRLRPDGTPDATYGAGGRAMVPLRGGTATSWVVSPRLDHAGRLVIALADSWRGRRVVFVRLRASGRADATFGGDGVVVRHVGFRAAAVVDLPDGRLVAIGWRGGIAAFTRAGVRDLSYGRAILRYPPRLWFVDAAAPTADGSIMLAGSGRLTRGRGVLLARLDGQGRLDRSFGRHGLVDGPADRTPRALLVARAGRIVLAETAYLRWGGGATVVERRLADGRPDPAFAPRVLGIGWAGAAGLAWGADRSAIVAPDDGTLVRLTRVR